MRDEQKVAAADETSTWQFSYRVCVSYVFVVVEAHVRSLAVPGVLSQLARIRTLG